MPKKASVVSVIGIRFSVFGKSTRM